ncbi:MAG: anthranilate synthase component I family protein [Nitrospirota bacterium]
MISSTKRKFPDLINDDGEISPLYKEIPYLPPFLVYEFFASKNSFLLESVKGPEKIARYSFFGFDPYLIFKLKDGLIEIATAEETLREPKFITSFPRTRESRNKGMDFCRSLSRTLTRGRNDKKEKIFSSKKTISSGRPLNVLKELVGSYKQKPFEHLPPFQGGAVGILSYDFAKYLEKLPRNSLDDLNLPEAHFLMIDRLIVFDHLDKRCWIIVCPGARNIIEAENSKILDWSVEYEKAKYEIERILKKVTGCKLSENPKSEIQSTESIKRIEIIYEMKKKEYMDIVKKVKEYIAAGDIFQANMAQRVSANVGKVRPWSLYKILRSINPSPFAAFVDFGNYQIVSSSPERLIRVKGRIIETRPIAGTRPRGKNTEEDEMMRTELLLNEKERAEHVMLIDLERNDLGRVSDYGTVHVDELMITEDYSHVIHIVSNIKGNLADGKDCFDAIKAAFPGGTITGVPKVRCMEIIDELEQVQRGPYTGSIGYIGFSGNMDLNIIIRTFVIKKNIAYVQVGAGIVADSEPEREYYETLKKAEALIRTLEKCKY